MSTLWTAATSVWRDCRESRRHKRWMTDEEHQEFLEHLDLQEPEESRVYQEIEAKLEYQETWDLLVSQVPRAHLVYLVSRVSKGQPASQD